MLADRAAAFRLWLLSAAVALLAASPAFAEAPARVRGTITAINDGNITVKERDGRTLALKTGPYTAYADVVPSSLDAIKRQRLRWHRRQRTAEPHGRGRARDNPREHARRTN
jgi:hypothetical protein